jgi:hypothetical protein
MMYSTARQAKYEDPLTGSDMVLDSSDLEDHISALLMYSSLLTEAQRARLAAGLRVSTLTVVDSPPPPVGYGADFDLADEVEQQIAAVRAIREFVMPGGRLAGGITSREAKEVVTSGASLLASLMKFHSGIVNMDRLRNLERAVVEVLKEESQELCERVQARLAERLDG